MVMEQVTNYNNVTQEVNIQLNISTYTGQHCMMNRWSWSRSQERSISYRRSTYRSE
jgi:hypothetical protein